MLSICFPDKESCGVLHESAESSPWHSWTHSLQETAFLSTKISCEISYYIPHDACINPGDVMRDVAFSISFMNLKVLSKYNIQSFKYNLIHFHKMLADKYNQNSFKDRPVGLQIWSQCGSSCHLPVHLCHYNPKVSINSALHTNMSYFMAFYQSYSRFKKKKCWLVVQERLRYLGSPRGHLISSKFQIMSPRPCFCLRIIACGNDSQWQPQAYNCCS